MDPENNPRQRENDEPITLSSDGAKATAEMAMEALEHNNSQQANALLRELEAITHDGKKE